MGKGSGGGTGRVSREYIRRGSGGSEFKGGGVRGVGVGSKEEAEWTQYNIVGFKG